MATWHYVATLFLFTVVSGQTVLPLPGCSTSSTWNKTDNTNVLGGTSAPGLGLDACQQKCASDSSCTGVDWDTNTLPGTCYLLLSPNAGAWRVGQAAGVTHYQLLSRGDSGCIPAVCYSWDQVSDMHVLGGIPNSAAGLDSCKSACTDDPLCVGIDYDPLGLNNCYLTHNNQLYSSPGVTHYNLLKTTGDNCSAGCVFYSPDDQAVLAYDINNVIYLEHDLLKAAVFLPIRCLIDSSGTILKDCYSYQVRERSGYYLRAMTTSSLFVHKFNESGITEKFPQRFYQDVSFVRHSGQPGTSYFSLETVSVDNYYVAGSGLTHNYQQPLYCAPAPPLSTSSVVVRDSCPLVWNRIRGALNKLFVVVPSLSDFETCRQYCITRPFCVGVGFSGQHEKGYYGTNPYTTYYTGQCQHIDIIQQDSAQQFKSDLNYDYYELQRTMPGTCRSGCRYSWSIQSSDSGQYLSVYPPCTSELDCRLQCVKCLDCIGVGFDGARQQWVLLRTPTPFATLIPIRYELSRITDACGHCVNSFATVLYAYDSGAASVGSSYTDSQCRTVCVNDRRCVGYELRDNNVCYVSKQIPTLTQSTLYHHVDIIRPDRTCGNGCVHEWELNINTAMEPGTNVVAYTPAITDRACRAACISNPLCTGIDWIASQRTPCYLGLSANIQINYGNAQNTYHFQLQRDSNCDE